MLNTYLTCVTDYCDAMYRQTTELKTRKLLADKKESPQSPTINAAIHRQVENAMRFIAQEISNKDMRFVCEVIPVGSAHEGTKIGCCDEFDFNFVLTDLSARCEVRCSPESPSGFMLLKASTPDHDEDLFNINGILNTRIVKFKFEMHVNEVLASLTFCEATTFECFQTYSTTTLEDFLQPRTTASKANSKIKLKFTKSVNGYYVPHDISVDIVPALRIDGWWPDDMHRKDLCETGDCHIVLTQPQLKYPWIGWTEPHGFISFARAESELLRGCPHVIKAAVMAVKRMSEYFCQYNFFSSHAIKTALFWCMDDVGFSSKRSTSNYNEEINADELLYWVQEIIRRLLCFAAQDYVPCYFMPKCHQPVWLVEKHLKQFHMRLFQHGLTSYTDLFSLNEQQSRDVLVNYFKSLFIFSHLMYWTVLSDDDELKLFIPSTINPLVENDVCTTLPPSR